MNLPTLLLAAINNANKGMTGYDLTQQFSKELSFIWSASHQQVYRELNKLEVDKLVKHELFPQEGKPDRKVYTITKAGKAALQEALTKHPKLAIIRDPLSVMLFASESSQFPLVEHLEQQLYFCRQRLEELGRQSNANASNAVRNLLLERQIQMVKAEISWIGDAIKELGVELEHA
ncbi:TPA: PadR family transcriptional regulator [Vibrio vulnificus]|nr:PadR family transcriptional regulator [Vibrio vulnificus]